MANDFKAGDVVQLKSGGPKMTVVERSQSGDFHCTWFDGSKRYDGSFSAEVLSLFEKGPLVV